MPVTVSKSGYIRTMPCNQWELLGGSSNTEGYTLVSSDCDSEYTGHTYAPFAAVSVGSGSGDKNYVHTQGSAATVWTINHGQGKQMAWTIRDGDNNIVIGEKTAETADTIEFTFKRAKSGTAIGN